MGLDYLNKKTWHTGSIKNIEQVWLREQEERRKEQAMEEQRKRLIEERHNEELKKLQVEAGFIPRSHLDRMEWMYDWGNKLTEGQKTNEEYLLGKAVDQAATKQPFMPTISKEDFSNQKCEDFSKLHEDPLFAIRQKEEQRKQEIRDNPFEIQRLLQQIEEKKNEKKLKKRMKKEQKKNKKEKKDKKKKSKKNSDRSRSRSKSSSSRSSSPQLSTTLSTQSNKSNTSMFYEKFMKERLGSIITQDDDGKLRVDYGLQKRLHKQQIKKNVDSRPMTEDEKDKIREEMKQNAKKIKEEKMAKHQADYEDDKKPNKGTFLKTARDQIYNQDKGDLADRIGRNKNRFQRLDDDDK